VSAYDVSFGPPPLTDTYRAPRADQRDAQNDGYRARIRMLQGKSAVSSSEFSLELRWRW
jgi:hypothetical protein